MRPCITSCNMERPGLHNLMLWGLAELAQNVVFFGSNSSPAVVAARAMKSGETRIEKGICISN